MSLIELIKKQFKNMILDKINEYLDEECEEYCTYHEDCECKNFILHKDDNNKIIMFYIKEEDNFYINYHINNTYTHRICDIYDFKNRYYKEEEEINNLVDSILEVVKHYQTTDESCEYCRKKLGYKCDVLGYDSTYHNFIKNMCKGCGNGTMVNLIMKINKEEEIGKHSCDICYTNSIEKIEDEKILYTHLEEHKCCKEKRTCRRCRNKCGYKCPFCCQILKI